MYVNGDVQVASDMEIIGAIVATGDIIVGGAATLTNPTDYPALVSVQGDIQMAGGASTATVNGWLYAMNGSISASGGASGAGLVAAQDVTVTGGFGVGTFEGPPFMSPGGGGGGSDGSGGTAGAVHLLSWVR